MVGRPGATIRATLTRKHRPPAYGRAGASPALGHRRAKVAPNSNYERFNCNNLIRCYWSWNYRGCWHQTCPPIVTRSWGLNSPHWDCPNLFIGRAFLCSVTSSVLWRTIGNVARLLPSLEVVAISQATSPESNPDSLYPLILALYYRQG